jgi:glutaminyl-tRNA synthetase
MSSSGKPGPAASAGLASNFIRTIVDADLASGKYASRRWGGKPGPARTHTGAPPDPARIRTRFPPEPNGYLHLGHAKSILLNFGLARDYGGACHMRFDDTNPTKEEQEYVDSILDAVKWLGGDWGTHLYYASDYFGLLYEFAERFIERGDAYVDSLSAEDIRKYRGTLTEPGRDSPYRTRMPAENLDLFRRMRAGEFADGAHVLRLKIDMRSPNMNMRDPAIYRIRHAHHHRTADAWCVYPLYDYTHCISDALENITHSVCTLEFEDHRPLYDWVLERLAQFGVLDRPLPQQIEFARLNLSYVVLSKRKLIQLVEEKHVEGWDDPRMPTLVGARRRGYTPEGLRLFADRIGVAKADSWIDYGILEEAMRDDLNERAQRRVAVLRPLKLVIDNYPADRTEECFAPNHPQRPELGKRALPFGRELWIETDDFKEQPPKGYFRLSPGAEVRLRYAYIVKCVSADRDAQGNVTTVHCTYDPESRSGTPGAEQKKVKGNIHWLACASAVTAEVRAYDRLFKVPFPGSRRGREAPPAGVATEDESGKAHAAESADAPDWLDDLNPDSKSVQTAFVEAALANAQPEERFQFERLGYYVADSKDHRAGRPVFNRTVSLRDTWTKGAG